VYFLKRLLLQKKKKRNLIDFPCQRI